MERKESRRVQITKLLLKSSLLDLLEEKNIRHITITELCETANVNRSTFYSYYDSPYDLLESMEQDIIEDTRAMLDDCPALAPKEKMLYLLERHLEYLRSHIREFQAFSSDIGEDFSLPTQTMNIILYPYIRSLISEKTLSPHEAERMQTFCAFGTIGIVKAWVRQSMQVPVRQLSHTIFDLIEKVFSAYH